MKKEVALLLACTMLAGCETLQLSEPRTAGEINTGYDYIPVDPLPVTVLADGLDEFGRFPPGTTARDMRRLRYIRCVSRDQMDGGGSDDDDPADVMDALPDHTIRMAVRTLSGEGEGGFGPVTVSARGTTYQVIADSIFADTTNVRFAIRASRNGERIPVMSLPRDIPGDIAIDVQRLGTVPVGPGRFDPEPVPSGYEEVVIPVYVGVGLRLTANLVTRRAGINLTNLPAIAASADAEQSSGTLTLQTLGVYNQQVASTFAIPSELSTTSVQNALVSLGAVKAIVYDRDTGTRPRLTGIYNPLPTSDPVLINKIYSALAQAPIAWAPCGAS